MQGKLIAELGNFASRLYDVRVALYGPEVAAELVEILSRHEAEQGEGLREAVKDVYEDIMLNEDTEYDDAESVAVKLGEILVAHPTPDKAVEPLPTAISGLGVISCPHCFKPVLNDVEKEPLAVLADRKGYCIRLIGNHGYPVGWLIHLQPKRALINGGLIEIPEGDNVDTYAQAEQAARAYLEGLPTKAEKGGE